MGIFWNRSRRGGRTDIRPLARRRHLQFTTLEGRRLLSVGGLTATAEPRIIKPPDGRFVSVVVSGTFTQVISQVVPGKPKVAPPPDQLAPLDAKNATNPAPKVFVQVTDQYRVIEPRGRSPMQLFETRNVFAPPTKYNPNATEVLVRRFSYAITLHLQAKSSRNTDTHGRQYDIDIFAVDKDGGNDKTIAAFVPGG